MHWCYRSASHQTEYCTGTQYSILDTTRESTHPSIHPPTHLSLPLPRCASSRYQTDLVHALLITWFGSDVVALGYVSLENIRREERPGLRHRPGAALDNHPAAKTRHLLVYGSTRSRETHPCHLPPPLQLISNPNHSTRVSFRGGLMGFQSV